MSLPQGSALCRSRWDDAHRTQTLTEHSKLVNIVWYFYLIYFGTLN